MATTQFQPSSAQSQGIGKLRIHGEGVGAQGGPIFPCLTISAEILLRSAETMFRMNEMMRPEDEIQDYTLLQICGSLLFISQGGSLGEIACFQSLPMSFFSRPTTETSIGLKIPLDSYQVQQIEGSRVGDVSLQFNFTFLFAKHIPIPRKEYSSPFEKFETGYVTLTVPVAQSDWVKNVLPGLGYGKRHLIEMPISEGAIREGIPNAIAELEEARRQMSLGDYNQVLGKCRNALEILSNARKYEGEKNPPTFADKIDSLLKLLPGAPTGARSDNLRRMLKDIHGFTSIAQHPFPPIFTRDDAEMTLTATGALLSYVSKFVSREE